MSLFTEKLKRLRGRTTINELAASQGVSVTSIYKAEQSGGVRWDTIRRIYGQFFTGDEDRLETLVLWAIDMTKEQFAQKEAMAMARNVVSDEGEKMAEASSELTQILAGMHPDNRELLMEFARCFALQSGTRLMAKAWLKALDECAGGATEQTD